MPSTKTKQEKNHMNKVAGLGCLICNKMGFPNSPAELHHIKNFTGIGRKANDFEVIPLCPKHHRQVKDAYHYGSKCFTEKWGTPEELLEGTLSMVKLQNE